MTTYFDWDTVEDNIVEEFDEAGATTADYTTEPYLYGDLVSQRRDGQSRFFHFDGLGSTTALTDNTGAITDTTEYSAFGTVTETSGSDSVVFRFNGRLGYYYCSVAAVYNVRRRIYSAATCRWLLPDPLGVRDTDMNGFCYVRNRAPIFSDPLGLDITAPDPQLCKCDHSVKAILSNAAFKDLLKCAIASGCLRKWFSVGCTRCSENAVYEHGTIRGSNIKICAENWNALTAQEQALVLFEELYHAVTICGDYKGKRVSPALQRLAAAWRRSAEAGRIPAGGKFNCFMCYGQEYLAKACARLATGMAMPIWGGLHGEVSASCGDRCNPSDFLPGSIEDGILKLWYAANALNECFNTDVNCILTGKR